MSKKVFWFDLETSGLNHHKHGIIQFAGMIEIDGNIEEEFEYLVKPDESLEITNKALEINQYTHRQIQSHNPEIDVFKNLRGMLSKYISKRDTNDKFFAGGYNVNFDIDFLSEFWGRHKRGKQYLGSFINRSMSLDPYGIIPKMVFYDEIEAPPSMQLKDVCQKYLDTSNYNWHDAIADVQASRDLFYKLNELPG